MRDLPLLYAGLAEQAARPRDLQRWSEALSHWAGSSATTPPTLAETLAAADAALQCYEDSPALDRAVTLLRQLIAHLYSIADEPRDGGWPLALLERVSAHERLIQQRQLGREGFR
jgi:hypothetical protein